MHVSCLTGTGHRTGPGCEKLSSRTTRLKIGMVNIYKTLPFAENDDNQQRSVRLKALEIPVGETTADYPYSFPNLSILPFIYSFCDEMF